MKIFPLSKLLTLFEANYKFRLIDESELNDAI